MNNYDNEGNGCPPQMRQGTFEEETGRGYYEAEVISRRAGWPPTPSLERLLANGVTATAAQTPAAPQPAAVIGCFYDLVAEVPRNRAELTEIGKRLPRGTQLYAHPEPPAPKPLPKLPKVPPSVVFGRATLGGETIELRGWTTITLQPWIDEVQALFKEQR